MTEENLVRLKTQSLLVLIVVNAVDAKMMNTKAT